MLFGFLGWLKLRGRDMSVLLEARGWALNGRMKLIRQLGLLFTVRPDLPKGSVKKRLTSSPRNAIIVAIIAALLIWLSCYLFKHPEILRRLREGTFFQL